MNSLPFLATAVFCAFPPAAILRAGEPATPPGKEVKETAKPAIQVKAEKLVLDRISFAETEIEDALQHIGNTARAADRTGQTGVNILLHTGRDTIRPFTADIRNASVWDVLTTVAGAAGLQMSIVGETILLHSTAKAPQERKAAGLTDAAVWKAMASTRIDRVSFAEADLEDVCLHYTKKAEEAGAPLNVVAAPRTAVPVTLDLRQATLTDLIEITAELTGQEITACGNIVVLRPPAKSDAKKAAAAPEWQKSAAWLRAESITMDRVSFGAAESADVSAFLTRKSLESDKERKGVSIAVGKVPGALGISFDVRHAALSDILLMLAETHSLEISVKDGAIRLGNP